MFLRNIFSKNEIKKLRNIKNLETYYDAFKFFLSVTTKLESAIKNMRLLIVLTMKPI